MKNKENHTKGLVFISMKKGKPSALLPIAVFLVFYLGLGIYSEYLLKIPMGFYNIPIVVAFSGSDPRRLSAEPQCPV